MAQKQNNALAVDWVKRPSVGTKQPCSTAPSTWFRVFRSGQGPGLVTRKVLLVYALGAITWALGFQWVPHTSELAEAVHHAIFIVLAGALLVGCLHWANRTLGACAARFEQATARATALWEAARRGILIVDERGVIESANPIAAKMFGYTCEELAGMQIEALVPERFREVQRRERAEFLEAPSPRYVGADKELYARRVEGREFPVEIGITLLPRAAQRLILYVVTDISERLQLEREARRSETLRALGGVAAGIAHELNNPLAIVSSRAELMLSTPEGQALAGEMREDLEVIHRNAQRASQIAHGLLQVARQRREKRQPVDLNSVVEDTLLLLGDQLTKDGIGLSTTLDRKLPKMLGNAPALEQVLINLIMNARDAVLPAGGNIAITTGPAPDVLGWLELAVKDTGRGLAPDALARLFTPFYSTKATGTGLGLWLSKRTVSEHGGTITAKSELGKGATFIIRLRSIANAEAARQ